MTRLGVSTGWRQTRSIDRSLVFFKQALESKGLYSKCDAPTVTNISCVHFMCFGSKIAFIFCKYVVYFFDQSLSQVRQLFDAFIHCSRLTVWITRKFLSFFFGMKQTWSINQFIIIIKQEGVKNHIVPESSRSLQQKFHRIPAQLEAKSFLSS